MNRKSLLSARDPFADDVLERLARSNQDYQRSHGHYIVPLSERLLEARAENERLRAELADRQEALAMLRAAWNHHFDVCTTPMPTLPMPTAEDIRAWMNAPSDTASA